MRAIERDKRFWDNLARKYANGQVADIAAYERTLAATQRYLKANDAVLEFGCGTGSTALKLAGHVARYVASDISSEMIAIGREKAQAEGAANISFEQAVLTQAPWPDNCFDAAIGFNVLHLVNDREATLERLARLIKPGGYLITKSFGLKEVGFGLPLMVMAMRAVGRAPTVAFFTIAELEGEMKAAGFRIVERELHGSKPKRDKRPFVVAQKAAP